jgi:dihydrofolate synthase/folylpolyglutamate synthase
VDALAASGSMRGARIVATSLDVPRALPADDLAAAWRRADGPASVAAEPDPDRALDAALADADGLVVVAGSLYLVGHVRGRLVDDPLLRDPVAGAR